MHGVLLMLFRPYRHGLQPTAHAHGHCGPSPRRKVESGAKLLMAMATVLVMVVGHPYVNLA